MERQPLTEEEINTGIDLRVAHEMSIPCTWEHPDYPVGTRVKVDESIKEVHLFHPLAGMETIVCHGRHEYGPGVPCAIPDVTEVRDDGTLGNFSIVPEQYIARL